MAVPDLVRYVFKAGYFARKDLDVPELLRKRYKRSLFVKDSVNRKLHFKKKRVSRTSETFKIEMVSIETFRMWLRPLVETDLDDLAKISKSA